MSPMLIPNQGAGKHSCIRPPGMYVRVTPDHQPCLYKLHTISMNVCYSSILSASMYVTFAPDRSHVWSSCIRPFAMSLTVKPNQQSCLLKLHLQVFMSDALALDQHSYFIVIFDHLCCLLHLQHTSIVVMVVTIAVSPKQQQCL